MSQINKNRLKEEERKMSVDIFVLCGGFEIVEHLTEDCGGTAGCWMLRDKVQSVCT